MKLPGMIRIRPCQWAIYGILVMLLLLLVGCAAAPQDDPGTQPVPGGELSATAIPATGAVSAVPAPPTSPAVPNTAALPPPGSPTANWDAEEESTGEVMPEPDEVETALPPLALTAAEIVEAELARLNPGRMLFNPPNTMTVGERQRVELRITREFFDPDSAGADPLLEELQGTGTPQIDPVQVGTFMRAELTGENFTIEALNNADQSIGPTGFTEWAWDVTPQWHGEQTLRLVVTVRVRVGEAEEVRDFPVEERLVTVAVNPVYTVATIGRSYWQFFLVALVLLVGVLLSTRMWGNRRAAVSPPAPPVPPVLPLPDLPAAEPEMLAATGTTLPRPVAPAPLPPTVPLAPADLVTPESPPRLAPETLIQNRYQIVRLIGKGGMGAVYAAIDQRLGSTVALKQTLVVGEQLDAAFEREARMLAGLRHPSLPRVTDYFQEVQGKFLVMEYFPGDDLATVLEQRGEALPTSEVLTWADQVLQALDYLHSLTPPVLHRDIKPQNLKLTPAGQIILLDFGLAKGRVGTQSQAATIGSVFGYTPHYAPPEQIEGSGTEPRSDLYALAATLYHLLTNSRPPTALERLLARQNEQPDPLHPLTELNPAVPAAVATVLHQALALRVSERPTSAADMRAGLGVRG